MRKFIDFLVTFDHDAGKQISLEEFRDSAKALKAYSEREEQYRDNPRMEVVLLGAESVDVLRVTHSNYFEDIDPFEEMLAMLGPEETQAAEIIRRLAALRDEYALNGPGSSRTVHSP